MGVSYLCGGFIPMAKNPFRCSKKKTANEQKPEETPRKFTWSFAPSFFSHRKWRWLVSRSVAAPRSRTPQKKRETARVSGAFRLATCPPLKFLEALKWRCPKKMEVDDKQKRVLKLLKGQIWLWANRPMVDEFPSSPSHWRIFISSSWQSQQSLLSGTIGWAKNTVSENIKSGPHLCNIFCSYFRHTK